MSSRPQITFEVDYSFFTLYTMMENFKLCSSNGMKVRNKKFVFTASVEKCVSLDSVVNLDEDGRRFADLDCTALCERKHLEDTHYTDSDPTYADLLLRVHDMNGWGMAQRYVELKGDFWPAYRDLFASLMANFVYAGFSAKGVQVTGNEVTVSEGLMPLPLKHVDSTLRFHDEPFEFRICAICSGPDSCDGKNSVRVGVSKLCSMIAQEDVEFPRLQDQLKISGSYRSVRQSFMKGDLDQLPTDMKIALQNLHSLEQAYTDTDFVPDEDGDSSSEELDSDDSGDPENSSKVSKVFLPAASTSKQSFTRARTRKGAVMARASRIEPNDGQRDVVDRILQSSARFLAVNSVAGSGKTTLVRFLKPHFDRIVYLAPTNAIVHEMDVPGVERYTVDKFFMKMLNVNFETWLHIKEEASCDNPLRFSMINVNFWNRIFSLIESTLIFVDEYTMCSVKIPNVLRAMDQSCTSKTRALFVGDFNQCESVSNFTGQSVKILDMCEEILFLRKHVRSAECPRLRKMLRQIESGMPVPFGTLKKTREVNVTHAIAEASGDPRRMSVLLTVSNERKYAYMRALYAVASKALHMPTMLQSRFARASNVPEDYTYLVEGWWYRVVYGSAVVYTPLGLKVKLIKNGIVKLDKITSNYLVISRLEYYREGRGDMFAECSDEWVAKMGMVRHSENLRMYQTDFNTGTTSSSANNSMYEGFPLEMLFCDNIYKSQGRTIEGNLYLDMNNCSRPSLYVALSRAKKINQIFINAM